MSEHNVRVEVKSAQFAWNKTHNYWRALWHDIKSDEHDELRLMLYTPRKIYLFVYEGPLSPRDDARVTIRGRQASTRGPCNEFDIDRALAVARPSSRPLLRRTTSTTTTPR